MVEDLKIRILVLDRGHVLIAKTLEPSQFGFMFNAWDARCIRIWGTSKGLTQLVKGPVSGTILDDPANETIPTRALLRVIEVEQKPWAKTFSA